jgi:hypothetical protein
MLSVIPLFALVNYMWYSVPLVMAISLVYAATRHELMKPILIHAARWVAWIFGLMFVVYLVLSWFSSIVSS